VPAEVELGELLGHQEDHDGHEHRRAHAASPLVATMRV
jgi:hypothetical protein